jgi:Ca-activated chloride channel homolog
MSQWFQSPVLSAPTGDFRFAAPLFLLALLLLPVMFAWLMHRERHRTATLRFATVGLLKRAGVRHSNLWRRMLNVMRVVALGLLVVAMARPQFGRVEKQTYSEGIDIMLVLDVSLSMRADDFYPNRLEAAKEVMQDFVDGRRGDRIGVVIFGTEALSLVPLTLHYGSVKSFIDRIKFNIVDGNTTAIGMGLSTALAKLKDSTAKSKIIILLTDGENNAGKIDPLTAAEAARTSKVRVYTIGVGSESRRGQGFFSLGPEPGIDEKSLTAIAEQTGGLYFRASDRQKLAQIYNQIDKLEKSRVEATQYDNFNDLIAWFTIPALLLLCFEWVLRSTRFLKVP